MHFYNKRYKNSWFKNKNPLLISLIIYVSILVCLILLSFVLYIQYLIDPDGIPFVIIPLVIIVCMALLFIAVVELVILLVVKNSDQMKEIYGKKLDQQPSAGWLSWLNYFSVKNNTSIYDDKPYSEPVYSTVQEENDVILNIINGQESDNDDVIVVSDEESN